MAAKKKVTLRVVGDGVQVDGKWHHHGQRFTVSEAKAKELLKTSAVIRDD